MIVHFLVMNSKSCNKLTNKKYKTTNIAELKSKDHVYVEWVFKG